MYLIIISLSPQLSEFCVSFILFIAVVINDHNPKSINIISSYGGNQVIFKIKAQYIAYYRFHRAIYMRKTTFQHAFYIKKVQLYTYAYFVY